MRPELLQLLALTGVEALQAEACLQREDGDVDLVAVEGPDPRVGIVRRQVDREASLHRDDLAILEVRRRGSRPESG